MKPKSSKSTQSSPPPTITINGNNNSNNKNNDEEENWKLYTDKMNNLGFIKSCIFDFNRGESDSGFGISYIEWQSINDILKGTFSISLSCNSIRFYIVNSNDILITGVSNNNSIHLMKTKNKYIIGIFDMNLIPLDQALDIIQDIYNEIISNHKEEEICNLIDSNGFKYYN